MNHIPSIQALSDSTRSISLAKVPTAQQIHDVCGKCAQMMADDSQDKVAVALSAAGINVVREPRK